MTTSTLVTRRPRKSPTSLAIADGRRMTANNKAQNARAEGRRAKGIGPGPPPLARRSFPLLLESFPKPNIKPQLSAFVANSNQRESIAQPVLNQHDAVDARRARCEILRIGESQIFRNALAYCDSCCWIAATAHQQWIDREAA